jgi:hypothetical protein
VYSGLGCKELGPVTEPHFTVVVTHLTVIAPYFTGYSLGGGALGRRSSSFVRSSSNMNEEESEEGRFVSAV